jgi:hypothetical protein
MAEVPHGDYEGEDIPSLINYLTNVRAAKKREQRSPDKLQKKTVDEANKTKKVLLFAWLRLKQSFCTRIYEANTNISWYLTISWTRKRAPLKISSIERHLRAFFEKADVYSRLISRHLFYISGIDNDTIKMTSFIHRILFDHLAECATKLEVQFAVNDYNPNDFVVVKPMFQPRPAKRAMGEDGEAIPIIDQEINEEQVVTTAMVDEVDKSNVVSYYETPTVFLKPWFDIIQRRFTMCARDEELRPKNPCNGPMTSIEWNVVDAAAAVHTQLKDKLASLRATLEQTYGMEFDDDIRYAGPPVERMQLRVDEVFDNDPVHTLLAEYLKLTRESDDIKTTIQVKRSNMDFEDALMGGDDDDEEDGGGDAHQQQARSEKKWDKEARNTVLTKERMDALTAATEQGNIQGGVLDARGVRTIKAEYIEEGKTKTATVIVQPDRVPVLGEDGALHMVPAVKAIPASIDWKTVVTGILNGINKCCMNNRLMPGYISDTPDAEAQVQACMDNFRQAKLFRIIIATIVELHNAKHTKTELKFKLPKDAAVMYA